MTNLIEYDLILNRELEVKASSGKTYMHNGWIPKADITVYKNDDTQEEERPTIALNKDKKGVRRQRSWIPLTKL